MSRPRKNVEIVRLVVAYPQDVAKELQALSKVVDELNRSVAREQGRRIDLSTWDTESYPGFHDSGAQGLIDEVLGIEDCDILIGIFWKRAGTPTLGHSSGTAYEINKAHECWKAKKYPQIMLYFSQNPANLSTEQQAQFQHVLELRKFYSGTALYCDFSGSLGNFADLARKHLTNFLYSLPRAKGVCEVATHATIYNTFYEIPGEHVFWNNLLVESKKRFYRVGRDNKYWIEKTTAQSKELGSAIMDLVGADGVVSFISEDSPGIRDLHMNFFRKYVAAQLSQTRGKKRQQLVEKLEVGLSYRTIGRINWEAVLSDDTLLVIPVLHDSNFFGDSPAIMLSLQDRPMLFHNFVSDIERLQSSESGTRRIDLSNLWQD